MRIRHTSRSAGRVSGVSLIEALVALAVMSFGMMALVGVQSTMRFNSDVARQRTEATRLAASEVESMRLFTDVAPSATQTALSWDELGAGTVGGLTLPSATANTSYTVQRSVALLGTNGQVRNSLSKVVKVDVRWADRGNNENLATLNTVVLGAAPALTARLSLPFVAAAVSQRGNRHSSVPLEARDLGNGTSAYKPFDEGSSAWVLNNRTGWVTQICTGVTLSQATLTSAALTTCSALTVPGRLVTGKVQFDLRTPAQFVADASMAETPQGPVLPLDASAPLLFLNDASNAAVNQSTGPICVSRQVADATTAATRTFTPYACVVFPTDTTGWGGQLLLNPGDYADATPGNWQIGTAATEFRVCRYTTAASDLTANANHPKTYCRVSSNSCTSRVTENLSHQNFLVLRATQTCPTDTAVDVAAGNLVNSNTLAHQP